MKLFAIAGLLCLAAAPVLAQGYGTGSNPNCVSACNVDPVGGVIGVQN